MKIVSGGQTGVDRAALDAARSLGLSYGGWVPAGRRAEDGVIPAGYDKLVESGSEEPEVRTRLNVESADATLIIATSEASPGTELTAAWARTIGKPLLRIDLSSTSDSEAAAEIRRWLAAVKPPVLNVAGPRASEVPSIYETAERILRRSLAPL